MHKLFKIIEPYIQNVELIIVATSKETQSWSSTVFCCYDEDLNIYFLSRLLRRHSQEIMQNKRVSVAIVNQNQIFGSKVKGLQIEGTCISLSGKEAENAFRLYKKRFPKVEGFMPEKLLTQDVDSFPKGEVIQRIWKITPTRIKIFDENKYGDVGKEFTL